MFLPCACLVLLLSCPSLWLLRLLYCLFFLYICVGPGIFCIHRAMSFHGYVCGLSPVELLSSVLKAVCVQKAMPACYLFFLCVSFLVLYSADYPAVFWFSCTYIAFLLSPFLVGFPITHVQSLWFSISITRSNSILDVVIICAFAMLPFLYCLYILFLSFMPSSGPLACICIIPSPVWHCWLYLCRILCPLRVRYI